MLKLTWLGALWVLFLPGTVQSQGQDSRLSELFEALVAEMTGTDADQVLFDGCSVINWLRDSGTSIDDVGPSIENAVDVVKNACQVQRHHPAQVNRTFLDSLRISGAEALVHVRTWASDRRDHLQLRFRWVSGRWDLVSADRRGSLYVVARSNIPVPENGLSNVLGAVLAVAGEPEVRVDDRPVFSTHGFWVPKDRVVKGLSSEYPNPVRIAMESQGLRSGDFFQALLCEASAGHIEGEEFLGPNPEVGSAGCARETERPFVFLVSPLKAAAVGVFVAEVRGVGPNGLGHWELSVLPNGEVQEVRTLIHLHW